jgi:hypothetical protein
MKMSTKEVKSYCDKKMAKKSIFYYYYNVLSKIFTDFTVPLRLSRTSCYSMKMLIAPVKKYLSGNIAAISTL